MRCGDSCCLATASAADAWGPCRRSLRVWRMLEMWPFVPGVLQTGPLYPARMTDRLLTAAEVADQLRVSTMTIYRLIRSGELPAVRVGRNYRVRSSDLDHYLDAQVVDPATMRLPDADDA